MTPPDVLDFALCAQADAAAEILGEGRGPEQTLELAENAQAFADVLIGRVHAAESGPLPACRRGCTACCHLHVVAAIPEVIRIADYADEHLTPEGRAALLARIDAHIAATSGMTGAERQQSRVACPLLEGGDCSVHPARPLSCRGWNSLDPALCDRDLANPREGVPARLHAGQFLVAGRVAEGLAIGARHRGADDRPLDMVRGLKIALERPDASDRWRLGEAVFESAVNAEVFPARSDPHEATARQALRETVARRLGWDRPG